MKSNGKLWFPGGGIECGEKQHEALTREIEEETGLKHIHIGRLLGSFENFFYYQPTDEAMHAFLFFYECSTDTTDLYDDAQVQDLEARNIQWTEIADIKKSDLADLPEEIYMMIRGL